MGRGRPGFYLVMPRKERVPAVSTAERAVAYITTAPFAASADAARGLQVLVVIALLLAVFLAPKCVGCGVKWAVTVGGQKESGGEGRIGSRDAGLSRAAVTSSDRKERAAGQNG